MMKKTNINKLILKNICETHIKNIDDFYSLMLEYNGISDRYNNEIILFLDNNFKCQIESFFGNKPLFEIDYSRSNRGAWSFDINIERDELFNDIISYYKDEFGIKI